jgi:putative polyhydroxyalkanoate system protein
MADISLHRTHSYGIDDARTKLEKLLTKFQASKPDMIEKITWSGDKNSAEAGGKYFKGQFKLSGSSLDVDLDLIGFAAKMAKGMVKDRLEKSINEEFPA